MVLRGVWFWDLNSRLQALRRLCASSEGGKPEPIPKPQTTESKDIESYLPSSSSKKGSFLHAVEFAMRA